MATSDIVAHLAKVLAEATEEERQAVVQMLCIVPRPRAHERRQWVTPLPAPQVDPDVVSQVEWV